MFVTDWSDFLEVILVYPYILITELECPTVNGFDHCDVLRWDRFEDNTEEAELRCQQGYQFEDETNTRVHTCNNHAWSPPINDCQGNMLLLEICFDGPQDACYEGEQSTPPPSSPQVSIFPFLRVSLDISPVICEKKNK